MEGQKRCPGCSGIITHGRWIWGAWAGGADGAAGSGQPPPDESAGGSGGPDGDAASPSDNPIANRRAEVAASEMANLMKFINEDAEKDRGTRLVAAATRFTMQQQERYDAELSSVKER